MIPTGRPSLRVIRFALTNRAYEVFDVGTVIEPTPVRPRLIRAAACGALARRFPALRRIVRHRRGRSLREALGISWAAWSC